MLNIIDSFEKINSNIKKINQTKKVNIIAVSKTFNLDHIKPLIDHGHDHFGENKVQEAMSKWRNMKKNRSEIKLHMIGKLQSNKAKNAFEIFDYIHSLDSKKLADIFSKCEAVSGKNLKYFIQVNIGAEDQKSGISISEVEQFYDYCKKEKKLNILGLMAIPPNDHKTREYFKTLNELNLSLGLKELSMGMSSDYEEAVKHNATFVRIGSSIFGQRS
tara:strand:+ start:3295 stop:3945 length:651 start_codon:yes stop_codon:yes gene_type:complete